VVTPAGFGGQTTEGKEFENLREFVLASNKLVTNKTAATAPANKIPL
jgi:hypothetical protein